MNRAVWRTPCYLNLKTQNMKSMIKKHMNAVCITVALLVGGLTSNANNLVITGTSVTGSDITFNISWDNSWNTNIAPANWDAVWVFVKYQDCSTRLWNHAGLSTNGGDHTAGSPLQVDPVSDGKGVFIRRSALGGGNIGSTAISLRMTIPAGTYNYKVFGIEMVNIPQANFELGDGTSASTFNSITINAASQSGGLTAVTLGGGAVAIPSTYPMGYNSFYSMKYEMTQEQYVEFLNTLTYDQQVSRTAVDPISAPGTLVIGSRSYYNGIVIQTSGNNNILPAVYACDQTAGTLNNTNDAQNKACNYVNWGDVSAYLDWAALRPMTEMEFEKICRGSMPRLANEYVWGSTNINHVSSASVTNNHTVSEGSSTITNGLCNYYLNVNSVGAPMRNGFAATATSGRESSGASYYGAMEMGGNLFEMCITTGNATGAAFNGTLGDGSLTSVGNANVATWPSNAGTGTCDRGGCCAVGATYCKTSDRQVGADGTTYNTTRYYYNGGRGVR